MQCRYQHVGSTDAQRQQDSSAFLFEDELVAKRKRDALRFGPDSDEARQLPASILLLLHGNVDQRIFAEHAPETNDRFQRSNRSGLHDSLAGGPHCCAINLGLQKLYSVALISVEKRCTVCSDYLFLENALFCAALLPILHMAARCPREREGSHRTQKMPLHRASWPSLEQAAEQAV